MVSRRTLVEALELLEKRTHAEIGRFTLKYGLENNSLGSSKAERVNNIIHYLINGNMPREEKSALIFDIVKELIDDELDYLERFGEELKIEHPKLYRALNKDGFSIENNEFRYRLPERTTLTENESELERLLNKYGMVTF